MVKQLSARIKVSLNITMAEFCKKHLNTEYRTFQYRIRRQSYYPAEVIYICWILNDNCENIFGKSFKDLVLLRDAPGITAGYIDKALAGATPVERVRLMDLIWMTGITTVPAARNFGPIHVTISDENTVPAAGPIKPIKVSATTPDPKLHYVTLASSEEFPKKSELPMAEELVIPSPHATVAPKKKEKIVLQEEEGEDDKEGYETEEESPIKKTSSSIGIDVIDLDLSQGMAGR